jgi:hypothetical protein
MVRHRVYDPKLGRWLERDPWGYRGGTNLLGYVGARPISLVDFLGLAPYQEGSTPPADASDGAQAASDMTHNSGTNLTLVEIRWIEARARATVQGGIALNKVDAAWHLEHFLDGSGREYTIRFSRMNRESTEARAHMIKEINDALGYAERFAKDGEWVEIVTSREVAADPGNLQGNWLYAVGGYRTWAQGRVRKCGSRYTLEWDFHFRDFYDWDINNGLAGGLVSDWEMGMLHRSPASRAREYRMTGTHSMRVDWKEGERYETGASVKGDGRPPRRGG